MPENDLLYHPFDPTKRDSKAMIESVREQGILEPLVLTLDYYILSGHRRWNSARLAGLNLVPVRFEDCRRGDAVCEHLLREYNRQRQKTLSEQLRESIVDADPEEAYRALLKHRDENAQVKFETLTIKGEMKRSRLTDAKEPFVQAVLKVLEARRKFWPLSDRFIHYQLLNSPPLIHASKPDSIYRNQLKSYKALTDVVTRARLEGRIPMEAIADPTRPVSVWNVHDTPATFFTQELNSFLKGYRRNLQQSQPYHVEIVGEKNTVQSILRPIASRFNIPLTIGRGFASLEPRYQVAQRFERSGKDKLVLLVASDFDPSGEEICQSFARSLRDDFYISEVELIKFALTSQQVKQYDLPPMMEAKETDSRSKKFIEEHGKTVYELEALPPETLQSELVKTIESVMDLKAFNQELDTEKQDSSFLANLRQQAHIALKDAA
jgi:hypothetical protein